MVVWLLSESQILEKKPITTHTYTKSDVAAIQQEAQPAGIWLEMAPVQMFDQCTFSGADVYTDIRG